MCTMIESRHFYSYVPGPSKSHDHAQIQGCEKRERETEKKRQRKKTLLYIMHLVRQLYTYYSANYF